MLSDVLQQPAWLVGCAFFFGLLIGSFLNVVILRIPPRLEWQWRRDSREILQTPGDDGPEPPGIVIERSFCPQCHQGIPARDNVPLLSWLVLRGRCRHCRAPISLQYPAVELLTALASVAVVWHFGPTWQSVAALAFTWLLIALSGIDLRTTLLPDQLTYPLLWLGLLVGSSGLFVDPAAAITGAAAGYAILWSVYWLFKLITGKEGMGRGDFKLLAALGAWCGLQGLPPIILLSALLGTLVGGGWLIAQGRGRATPIPFGPYLALAGWAQMLWGKPLLALFQRIGLGI